jgi:hypothetical protein
VAEGTVDVGGFDDEDADKLELVDRAAEVDTCENPNGREGALKARCRSTCGCSHPERSCHTLVSYGVHGDPRSREETAVLPVERISTRSPGARPT